MSKEDEIKKLIKEDEFKKFLFEKFAESKANQTSVIIDDEYIQRLKDLCTSFGKEINFEKGNLVKWKKGLKNRRIPEYNQPGIIINILENPIFALDEEIGNTNFNEPLNIAIGILIDDRLSIFHYDRRRFELY